MRSDEAVPRGGGGARAPLVPLALAFYGAMLGGAGALGRRGCARWPAPRRALRSHREPARAGPCPRPRERSQPALARPRSGFPWTPVRASLAVAGGALGREAIVTRPGRERG